MIDRLRVRAAVRRLMPGAEAVTLYVRSSGDARASYASYAIDRARIWHPASTESGNPVVSSSLPTAKWKFGRESLEAVNAPDPKIGDVIGRSDGTLWLIERITNSLLGEYFDLDTQRWKGSVA